MANELPDWVEATLDKLFADMEMPAAGAGAAVLGRSERIVTGREAYLLGIGR